MIINFLATSMVTDGDGEKVLSQVALISADPSKKTKSLFLWPSLSDFEKDHQHFYDLVAGKHLFVFQKNKTLYPIDVLNLPAIHPKKIIDLKSNYYYSDVFDFTEGGVERDMLKQFNEEGAQPGLLGEANALHGYYQFLLKNERRYRAFTARYDDALSSEVNSKFDHVVPDMEGPDEEEPECRLDGW